jgi:chromosome segregation protein
MSQASVTKGRLESQIQVLNEQIRAAEMTDEHLQGRLDAIEKEKAERLDAKQGYDEKKSGDFHVVKNDNFKI